MSNIVTSDLEERAFSCEPLVALVSDSHPLAARRWVTLADLEGTPFVVGSSGRWRGFRALIDEVALRNAVSLEVAEEADDLPVLLQLVRSGFGWTILNASFVPTLPPGTVALPLKRGGALRVSLAWQRSNASPLLERFIRVADDFSASRSS
jgi:DNA-binding transcriptional LysR family regulator